MSNRKTVILSFLLALIVVTLLICADQMSVGAEDFVSYCVKVI